MDINLCLGRLIELQEYSEKFDTFEVKQEDAEALELAVHIVRAVKNLREKAGLHV